MTEVTENEIRIGNWFNLSDRDWCYRQPDSNFKSFNFQWEDRDWYQIAECCMSLRLVEPIPITKEILQKMGFVKTNMLGDGTLVYKGSPYLYFKNGCVSISIHVFECKYVHQLQNLYFALTGKELTVTEQVKHWYAKTKHTEWQEISDETYELTKHLVRFDFEQR